MAHIDLPDGVPGIGALFQFRPATAAPLRAFVDELLRGDGPLARGDRELIAAYVSRLNECQFCEQSHSTFAGLQLDGGEGLVDAVKAAPDDAPITPRLRALLAVAAKVQQSGLAVTDADIAAARAEGATDVEIHDTVLIAAAFCMFNRYVDGLATPQIPDADAYLPRARFLVEHGYSAPFTGGAGCTSR